MGFVWRIQNCIHIFRAKKGHAPLQLLNLPLGLTPDNTWNSITEEIVHEDVEELGKDIKNATKKYSVEQSLYTDKLIKDSIGKGNKLTFKKEKRVFSVKGGETRASALLSIAEGDRTRVSVSKSVVESIKERAKLKSIS